MGVGLGVAVGVGEGVGLGVAVGVGDGDGVGAIKAEIVSQRSTQTMQTETIPTNRAASNAYAARRKVRFFFTKEMSCFKRRDLRSTTE